MEKIYTVPPYISKLMGVAHEGYPFLVQQLSSLLETSVILTDTLFQPLSIFPPKQRIEIDFLESICPIGIMEGASFQRAFMKINEAECEGICYTIKINKNVAKYLIVVSNDNANTMIGKYSEIIQFAANLIEFELRKKEEFIQERKKIKDVFLFDLIYGNIKKNEEIITYGKLWEWDFKQEHSVIVFSLTDFDFYSEDPKRMELIEYTVNKIMYENLKRPIILGKRSEIVLIYLFDNLQDSKTEVEQVLTKIKTNLKDKKIVNRLQIGIGKKRSASIEIYKSYQEAKVASELGRLLSIEIPFFSKLGLEKILYNHETQEVKEFYEQILGKLVEEDRINESELLNTLEALVANQFDLVTTADKLFIHKNTLRYRIKKIEETMNEKLSDMDTRLNVVAALKIKQLNKLK